MFLFKINLITCIDCLKKAKLIAFKIVYALIQEDVHSFQCSL